MFESLKNTKESEKIKNKKQEKGAYWLAPMARAVPSKLRAN